MPRGREEDYEVVIPVTVKDETARGAKSASSNVERMARDAAMAAQRQEQSRLNSAQRMVEAERRFEQQRARDSSRYAEMRARDERRSAEQSSRDQIRFAQQAERERSRASERASREQVRLAERADHEQRRIYEQNVRAFERVERERVHAAERANREIERDTNASQERLQRTARKLAVAGGVLTAAVSRPLAGLAGEAINRFASYDAQVKGLEALYKQQGKVTDSAEATKKKLVELREVAKLPGLGFREAIQGQLQLQAITAEADKATKYIAAFGKAIASTGGGKNELDRVLTQLTQMLSIGKVTMQDLKPIMQASPAIAKAIKDEFGSINPKEIMAKAGDATSFVERLVKRMESLVPLPGMVKNALENMDDAWDVFLISVGKILTDIPAVNKLIFGLADAIDNATEWIKGLDPAWQTAIAAFGLAVVALGPLLLILGAVTAAVGAMGVGVAAVVGAAVAIGAAWAENVGGIREKTMAVLEAVRALWAEYGPPIVAAVQALWEGAKTVVVGVVNGIVDFVRSGLTMIQKFWAAHGATIAAAVKTAWGIISGVVTEVVGFIVGFVQRNWPLIRDTVVLVMEAIGSVVMKIVDEVLSIWRNFGPAVMAVVKPVWETIKSIIETTLKVIIGAVKFFAALLSGEWGKAWEALRGILEAVFWGIIDGIKNFVGLIIGAVKGIFLGIWGLAKWVWEEAWKLGKAVVDGVWAGIKEFFAPMGTRVANLFKDMVQKSRDAVEAKSPSMVYYRLGRDIGMGLVLGFASMQQEAQAALNRLVIPDKPEMASGKGSGAINKARAAVDKRDRPGWDTLEGLYRDIDALAPAEKKTRELTVLAELARNKYADLAPHIRSAIIEAAKFFDTQKAGFAVEDALAQQLDAAEKKLFELRHELGENATAVERFNFWLAELRETSPATAAALDKQTAAINKARDAWAQADKREVARKQEAAVKKLGESVATMADDAEAALRRLDEKGETHLEALISRFGKLTDLGLTLSELDPLRNIVASIADLPPETRLKAIADALTKIVQLSGGRPKGMTDTEWDKFLGNASRAIDATGQADLNEARTKSAEAYSKLLGELNDKLVDNNTQTERARVEKDLETGAYRNLTEAQKDSLRQRASEVDLIIQQRAEQERLISALEDYADQVADVIGNAFDALLEGDFKGFWSEIKHGFSQLWRDIVGDLFRSGVRQAITGFFKSLMGIGGSGTGVGGGGGGNVFGNLLGKLFGLPSSAAARTPGFAGGFPAAGTATTGGVGGLQIAPGISLFGSNLFGSSLPSQPSISGSLAPGILNIPGLRNLFSSGMSAAGSAAGGFSWAGLGTSAAGILPMLGLGLGASFGGGLGKGSALGGLLGTVGGGILGGAAGLLGAGALMTSITGVGAFSSMGALSGFAPILGALPWLAPIAGALLIGSYFIGRNQQRRKEETIRDQVSHDTGTQIWQLIGQAQAGRLGLDEARSQFAQIKQRYFDGIAGIKDKKTRRIAEATWNHFQALWPILEKAAKESDAARNNVARMSPAFAEGGGVWTKMVSSVSPVSGVTYVGMNRPVQNFWGRVPGVYDRRDDKRINVTGDEVVLTPDVWKPMASYLEARGVPGIGSNPQPHGHGRAGGGTVIGASDEGYMDPTMNASVTIDREGMATIVLESRAFKKAVVKRVKVAVVDKQLPL